MADFTEDAVLVVAHPDDEALWFSAVLRHVSRIVFCFSDYEKMSSLGPARRKVVSEYPLQAPLNLDLHEAGTFQSVDWRAARETDYGLEISTGGTTRAAYIQNFQRLRQQLHGLLGQYRNVITHNPWGEYGHPDHVQVYRAIKSLQADHHFSLWYSNYCGNRSVDLAFTHMSGFSSSYKSMPTDTELAARLRALYQKHDCWTWYDDYEWFTEEAYMEDPPPVAEKKSYGRLFPLNMIKTSFPLSARRKTRTRFGNILRSLERRRSL